MAEEVKTRADMKKAKLTQKEIASFFASSKSEAQKQEDEHKALVKKETSARTKKQKAADKKTAVKTQPREDVWDDSEARWLNESDRRDAAANAEGKVISASYLKFFYLANLKGYCKKKSFTTSLRRQYRTIET